MKPYPSYKDSEIEWIGEIPIGWSVKRNKFITTPKKDKSKDGSEELLSVSEYLGVVPRSVIREGEDHLTRSESLEGYLKVSKGDLVNNIMLMWKKGLGVSKYDGIVSPSYSVFSFNDSVPTYHHYLFRTDLYVTEFRKNSTGIIQSRLRLYDDDFGDIYSYLPPLPEQKQIVSFLDHKTQKIDELIEKTEKKIELLKEKRTALINHCVTKGLPAEVRVKAGLNPNVEMKESGVEWIGEIPKDWQIVPFRRVAKRIEVGIAEAATHAYTDDESGIPIIRSTNIKDSKIKGDILRIKKEFAMKNQSKTIFENDILTVRTGNAGLSAVIPKYLNGSQCFTMLISTLKEDMYPHYFNYFLNTKVGSTQFEITAWGTAQKNISVPILGNTLVCTLGIQEQNQIVEYLDEQTKKIDSTIEKETQRIELLKEYRQSLISEVVTGKVDVRDWNR